MDPYRRSRTSSLWPRRQPEVSVWPYRLRIQDGTLTLQIWVIFLRLNFLPLCRSRLYRIAEHRMPPFTEVSFVTLSITVRFGIKVSNPH